MRRFLILLALTASSGSAWVMSYDTLPVLYTRFELDTSAGVPRVGESFTLSLVGRTQFDIPYARILVTVPLGVYCFEDSTAYDGSCLAGDSVIFDICLRIDHAGPWQIRAHVLLTDRDTLRPLQHLVSDFYVYTDEDTVYWAHVPLDGIEGYNYYAEELGERPGCPTDSSFSHPLWGFFQYESNGVQEPMKGIDIRIRSYSSGATHNLVTSSAGYYYIDLPEGVYSMQGRYAKARSHLGHALEVCTKALGQEHYLTLMTLAWLARTEAKQGNCGEAEQMYRDLLPKLERVLGPEHPHVAKHANWFAEMYGSSGRYAEAGTLYHRALAIREKAFGPDHKFVAETLEGLAKVCEQTGRAAEAQELSTRAKSIRDKAEATPQKTVDSSQ